jgi:hypothetical protein
VDLVEDLLQLDVHQLLEEQVILEVIHHRKEIQVDHIQVLLEQIKEEVEEVLVLPVEMHPLEEVEQEDQVEQEKI